MIKKSKYYFGVYLQPDLLASEAFAVLNGNDIRILLGFYQRRRIVKKKTSRRSEAVIQNNGEIVYTFQEAKQQGIPEESFNRGKKKLIKLGFLDVAFTGGGLYRSANLYHISDRWKNFGTPEFEGPKEPKGTRFKASVGFKRGHEPYGNQKKSTTENGNGSTTKTGNGNTQAVTNSGNRPQR